MTIAYVRSASGQSSSASSLSISFDATGCDAIVVGARDTGTTSLITGVTYNGVAMTLARHDGTDGRGSAVYVITGPASGVHNVVISYSGAQSLGAIVSGYSGVHQATPVGNVAGRSDSNAGGSGTGPGVNVPITLSAGSVAVDFFVLTKGTSTAAPTVGGSQTLVDGMLDGGFAYDRMSYLAGATQMSWVWGGPGVLPQSHSVIELKVAGASTVTGVTVSPSSASVAGSTTQTFTATVAGTGSPSQAVSWSASAGSITSGGVFTAPATTGSAQTITITATSTQDGSQSGTATVTVPAFSGTVSGVTVSPSAPSVAGDTTQTFVATVAGTGSPSQSVTWAASIGSITSGGVWTAPTATGSIQTATITATSAQDGTKSGTAAPTVPAAIVPLLSAAFLDMLPNSLNFADRVKDTTTTLGTGTITLANAAVLGYQTLGAAFAVGTKNIPYVIEDPTSGDWEQGLGTLVTSTTLSRTRVFSSSNAGNAVSFAAGTKSVFVSVPASAINRFAVRSHIDIRRYQTDPTFTNDSTDGWQAAINDAYLSNIQTIVAPPGRYKIGGPLKSPDGFGRGSNFQLYIPASPWDTSMKHIRIIGDGAPVWMYGALSDQPVPTSGVILESTLTPGQLSGTNPALLGASYGYNGGFGFFNFTDLSMENINLRTNAMNGASAMCALNCQNMSNGPYLNQVRIDVNRGLFTNPDALTAGSIGLIGSPVNNSGMFKIGNLFIGGFGTGARFSEHMMADRLTIYGCGNGIQLMPAYHASSITHLNVEECKNAIVVDGNHALSILLYDAEHKVAGKWFDFVNDIKYNSGTCKVVIQHSHVVQGGVGINYANWNTNATSANYKVISGAGEN